MRLNKLTFPYGAMTPKVSIFQQADRVDPALKSWLQDGSSLTRKLRPLCRDFEVKILGEQLSKISDVEFPQQTQPLWVREVLLCLDSIPWIFARTLIPAKILADCEDDFLTLGTQPLGELLYTHNAFTAGDIEFITMSQEDKLAGLVRNLGQEVNDDLIGRRRYFLYKDSYLTVNEVFLPAARQAIARLPLS